MSSNQIKLTVSESEREWLEQEADKRGISVSAFLHEMAFGKTHKTLIDYGELEPVHLTLPTSLLNELKDDADAADYSLSKYITILCAQKGRPVIVKINPIESMKEFEALHLLYGDFKALANMAEQNGELTNSNIWTIEREFEDLKKEMQNAIVSLDDKVSQGVAAVQRQLNREIREVKHGNPKDN